VLGLMAVPFKCIQMEKSGPNIPRDLVRNQGPQNIKLEVIDAQCFPVKLLRNLRSFGTNSSFSGAKFWLVHEHRANEKSTLAVTQTNQT